MGPYEHFDFRARMEELRQRIAKAVASARDRGNDPSLAEAVDALQASQEVVEAAGEALHRVQRAADAERQATQTLISALEEERSRLNVLLETIPVGVFIADADGQVHLVNREARRLLGDSHAADKRLAHYERMAIYRRPDGSAYEPEDLPLQRALYQGETVIAEEIRFEFPDEHTLTTLVNAAPVSGADGKPLMAIAVIEDLTPLQESERVRNQFLAMISHELRVPLTSIKGAAALARSPNAGLRTLEEIGSIVDEQADRMQSLVRDLLDASHIETGALSVNPEDTDLYRLLRRVVDDFGHSHPEARVDLSEQANGVHALADNDRVRQVMENLLANAARFSPPGMPIRVSVDQNDGMATVTVADFGRGIAQDEIPLLFRKFSRLDEDGKHPTASTGLGLSICKGVVEAHGGRIWAESNGRGEGATFRFTLPLAPTPPPDLQSVAQRASHLGRVSRHGERTKVLIVDEEPQVLRLVQRVLYGNGYKPIVARDGEEAVVRAEYEEPDCCLLDLNLPDTDGITLLKRLREFCDSPAIMLSGESGPETIARALRSGADDYVTKPFSPNELIARIEAALRRRVHADTQQVRPPLVLGPLHLDFASRRVTMDGKPVGLTGTEYKLLYELAKHPGRFFTHAELLQRIWGPAYSNEDYLTRAVVRSLRRKLGDDAHNPRFIFTERGIGYRLMARTPVA